MLMQPFVVGGLTKASGPPVTLPGRQTLIHAPTRFGGGVWADTGQLGRIPSWGPEIGMLTAKADRQAVYAAHKAAGAQGLWFCTFIHYQEDGVAYPDGIAGWNDFTGNFSQAAELACEILESGLYPCIELGGDELGSQTVIDQFPAFIAAMKSSRLGDLTQGGLMVTPTFDTDADGDWSDPGDNWARVFVALRAQMPDAMVLCLWLPAGWGRLGAENLNESDVHNAEACVDRFCQEGPATTDCEFLAPWPAILPGSQWDSEHGIYQPNWASDPSGWLQFVQMMARRVQAGSWVPPPDEPFDVPGGLGIGGPQNGQPVTVSADARHPTTYTFNTGRGETTYSWEEINTFGWTHQDGVTPEQLDSIRMGIRLCGCNTNG